MQSSRPRFSGIYAFGSKGDMTQPWVFYGESMCKAALASNIPGAISAVARITVQDVCTRRQRGFHVGLTRRQPAAAAAVHSHYQPKANSNLVVLDDQTPHRLLRGGKMIHYDSGRYAWTCNDGNVFECNHERPVRRGDG